MSVFPSIYWNFLSVIPISLPHLSANRDDTLHKGQNRLRYSSADMFA